MEIEAAKVIGAGLAGLGYAHFTTRPFEILEKEDFVGGVASSHIHHIQHQFELPQPMTLPRMLAEASQLEPIA